MRYVDRGDSQVGVTNQSFTIDERFYLDGLTSLTNQVILDHTIGEFVTLDRIELQADKSRTSGVLIAELLISSISTTTVQLDNANPMFIVEKDLNIHCFVGDLIQVTITTTAYTPLNNSGKVILIFK